MYFSQVATILVMLVLITSAVFYQTVEYKTKEIRNEMDIKKISLAENNIKSTVDNNIDKIVNDVFVNISYEIMSGERDFFENTSVAEKSLENNISSKLNSTLLNISSDNISVNVDSVKISPTDNPTKIEVEVNINLKYNKKIRNISVAVSKNIIINKNIVLKNIPDPYIYRNNFYYSWNNGTVVEVNNMTDNNYHTFPIVLNNTNFNYDGMYNKSTPKEIRIIGKIVGGADNDNILLPYWVQVWREGPNEVSIIWVNCSRGNLINNINLYILYNSTTKIDKQNPKETFILFDDFNDGILDNTLWNSSGGFEEKNGILKVFGMGSSVFTYKNYSDGYQLVFRGNFTDTHAQSVGFFKSKSDYLGVGWDYYNTNWGHGLYIRNNETNEENVPNGVDYTNNFYIYSLKRNNILTFEIYDDENNNLWSNNTEDGNDHNEYPLSINTLVNENATVQIDWIFLKDINGITTTVSNNHIVIPLNQYNESKPKTFKNTIYYGDPEQYDLVSSANYTYAGNYSILGILSNKRGEWGSVGYRPKIETD